MTIQEHHQRRIARTASELIDAPPSTVFPLLCPVREAEWLEGWTYDLVYSVSGLVEDGAVFTTPGDGEPDTVWVVSQFLPESHRVEFVRVTPGSRTCLLSFAVRPEDSDRSRLEIRYEHTALSAAGESFLAGWTAAAFQRQARFLADSMNHFLRTGARLPRRDH